MAHRTPTGRTNPAGREAGTFGGQPFVEAATKASMAGLQNAGQIQAETLRFVTERMTKDLAMPARLATCQNIGSVLEEQWKFTATMMKDYGDEGRRMLDLLAAGARGDVKKPSAEG